MARSLSEFTLSAVQNDGLPTVYASTPADMLAIADDSPICERISAGTDEPTASSPRGKLPVMKYRRPTSWAAVSIVMPLMIEHSPATFKKLCGTAGPNFRL